MRLDTLQSRAATSERLLSEARQNLIVHTEEVRAFDRESVEATIARNNGEKRLVRLRRSTRSASVRSGTMSRHARLWPSATTR